MAEARRLPRIPVALGGFCASLGLVVDTYAGVKDLVGVLALRILRWSRRVDSVRLW